jgi:beta-glucosidase
MTSDEVPQVYLGPPAARPSDADFPAYALVAFDRVKLSPGQKEDVTIHVPVHRLEYWSTRNGKWEKALGERSVLVGRSSRELPLTSKVTIR